MRADARRNRDAILNAAIELILEVGTEPSRDAVAERAGVGIATLYRHFPDQQQLLKHVATEVLDRTIREGRAALKADTGGEALRRYMHAAIECGLGAVHIVHPLLDDHHWPDQTDAARDVLHQLVDAAARDGTIKPDYTTTDVVHATIRFCRPLEIGLDAAHERAIAHQQIEHYLDGLATTQIQSRSKRGPTARI